MLSSPILYRYIRRTVLVGFPPEHELVETVGTELLGFLLEHLQVRQGATQERSPLSGHLETYSGLKGRDGEK